jgi:hypothetical protein
VKLKIKTFAGKTKIQLNMAYNPLSEAEKTFILHGVGDDLRNDGRSRRDFRPMELQVKLKNCKIRRKI